MSKPNRISRSSNLPNHFESPHNTSFSIRSCFDKALNLMTGMSKLFVTGTCYASESSICIVNQVGTLPTRFNNQQHFIRPLAVVLTEILRAEMMQWKPFPICQSRIRVVQDLRDYTCEMPQSGDRMVPRPVP